MKKLVFSVFFGNRGFFPGELIASARREMTAALEKGGYGYLVMDESLTRYGAVETQAEGKLYADFLKEHEGEFDGVIVCLPNFGDENGAYRALKDAGVPILMQAYPDELGKMDFARRRDAVCGKIAMCNVFRQAGIKYTLTENFAVDPSSEEFQAELNKFAAICRVVKKLKSVNIGAIGARTTAFKTVRIDEIAMQRMGVNVETIDLSRVFAMMDLLTAEELSPRKAYLSAVSDFNGQKEEKLENLARLSLALDRLIEEYSLDAVALRCWDELQKRYGIAPCVILGDLNERRIPAACELDVNNAVMMLALQEATNHPVMLFDVNNNYGDDIEKAILFHCGPAPTSMMQGKGHIEQHLMFQKTYGDQSGVGLNVGKIITGDVTIGSLKTEDGKLCAFVCEGELTGDKIDKAFFGCGTVFKKRTGTANDMLNFMAENGYRHHVAIAKNNYAKAVEEALGKYLCYQTKII